MHNDLMRIGNKTYSVNDIDYIFWRREKFQLTGIEIYFRTGKSVLLDFLNIESRSMANSISKRMTRKDTIVQRSPSSDFIRQLGIVQDWSSGQLSNFDYLMWINVIAGRSFHDPCQYPIFPWVLSDYKSDTLDLTKPGTFRDLSKPLGAINQQRLDDLLTRLEDLKRCGYSASLYSSYCSFPLAVFLYLIRMEPFTSLHIALQGGRFDTPQRIFQSVSDCYYLVTCQFNDYRELIPEFFFEPEFLSNPNGLNLGTVEGKSIGEVALPPWSKNAMDFVYFNRKALESDTVSKKLNHWIDLVFGYQQRDEEAVAAHNRYRDEIYDDIWSKEPSPSDGRRREVETLIEQIGQAPFQLFLTPHPTRELPTAKRNMRQDVVFDLPSKTCLHGSFCDRTSSLVIFDSSASCLKYQISFFPTVEVRFENITSRTELPKDLNSFVDVAENLFAALCNQNLMCVLLDVDRDLGCQPVATDRRKITSISACDKLVSLSFTDGRTHGYSHRGVELFSIPTYRNTVLCSCMSRRFGVVVSGTDDGCLVVASIDDGSTIRVIKLDAVPVKVVVTPNWGFIVVNVVEYINGKPHYSLSVFNINGFFVRTAPVPHQVDRWTVWTSTSGFDFMLLSAHRGKLYAFEVFFLEVGLPIYRCRSELIALDYGMTSGTIITVTSDGKVRMIPFRTETIEK
jgi:hypothetical protein